MKHIVLCCFCLLHGGIFAGSYPVLSPDARVSLLTASPGEELYSAFGHTAIWINDPANGVDRVYNYGTFDFNAPNFYLRFLRGQLLYMVDVTEFRNFHYTNYREQRSLIEQVLNLTQAQKQAMFASLEDNALPENRTYLYDFFYDNCATRPRDVIENHAGESLAIDLSRGEKRETFRNLIDLYLVHQPWADFGIDLILGMPTDKIASGRERLFLPDELYLAFKTAAISSEGKALPLVREERILLPGVALEVPSAWSGPLPYTWIIFIVAALFTFLGPADKGRLLDLWLFFIAGLLGFIMLFMWFATDHSTTKWNLNILWAFPGHLYAAWLILRRKAKGNPYFAVTAVVGFILIVFWIGLPQQLHQAVAPIILLLTIRAWRLGKLALRK